jgi:hypothetical protein
VRDLIVRDCVAGRLLPGIIGSASSSLGPFAGGLPVGPDHLAAGARLLKAGPAAW